MRIADAATYAGGAAVALGATVWVHAATARTLAARTGLGALAAVGRGALTAHLAATGALAAAAQGWGLGLHGSLTPGQHAAAGAAAGLVAATAGWTAGRRGPGPAERLWLAASRRLVEAARS